MCTPPPYAVYTPADTSREPEHTALPEGGHKIGVKRSERRAHPKGGGWRRNEGR